jgi:peptidylprolyl isomerase
MMMTQAKSGDTVRVHYTGTLDDGTVFDSSYDREPLEFTLGEGQVIRGFEEAILGMEPGETKTARIAAGDAYGQPDGGLVTTFPKDQFPDGIEPKIGQMLQIQQSDGRIMIVRVTGIDEGSVTLDANHPLAGRDLTFEVELVAIE